MSTSSPRYLCLECEWHGSTPSITDASTEVERDGRMEVDRTHLFVCPSCFGTNVISTPVPDDPWLPLKRALCVFGIHWSIVTHRFGMGDGKSCDICGTQRYGYMLHVRARKLGEGEPPNPIYERYEE